MVAIGKKQKKFITVAIFLIIILSLLITVGIYQYSKLTKEGNLTALEAKKIGEPEVKKLFPHSILTKIAADKSTGGKGKFDVWFLYFVDREINSTVRCEVKRDAKISISTSPFAIENITPLSGANIDSDEAYNIAMEDVTIRKWLVDHPDSEIYSFSLIMSDTDSHIPSSQPIPVYVIELWYWVITEHPPCIVYISAINGSILLKSSDFNYDRVPIIPDIYIEILYSIFFYSTLCCAWPLIVIIIAITVIKSLKINKLY
ncbi:MAG: hypothetical protein QW204_05170 [Thermoplasmata archaeon]